MLYKLKRSIFDPILPSQREELMASFEGCKIGKDYITIEYEDKNYKCAPYLEQVLDSKVQALSFFSGCGENDS